MKQSSKQGVFKTTKRLSPLPIGSTFHVSKNETDNWATLHNVTQDNGIAVCDGSTLDNSSGIYDDFLAATGSLTLANGPFRTEEVALTFSNTPAGWSGSGTGVAYSDTNGEWRFVFNISATATGFTSETVDIDGVVFSGVQALSATSNSGTTTKNAFTSSGIGRVNVGHASANAGFWVSGDVALSSKPTWADANMVDTPVISLQTNVGNALSLPPATATQAGTVTKNKWQRKSLTSNLTGPSSTFLGFNNLVVGKTYRYFYSLNITPQSGDTVCSIRILHDGAFLWYDIGANDGTGTEIRSTGEAVFTATSTSVSLSPLSFSASSVVSGHADGYYSFAILEELNNYDTETTDFT